MEGGGRTWETAGTRRAALFIFVCGDVFAEEKRPSTAAFRSSTLDFQVLPTEPNPRDTQVPRDAPVP